MLILYDFWSLRVDSQKLWADPLLGCHHFVRPGRGKRGSPVPAVPPSHFCSVCFHLPQVARGAEGMRPDTSRKPSLLFMTGHASYPGLHYCSHCRFCFPVCLLLLEPTVGLHLAPIAQRATKCRSIRMVTVWRELSSPLGKSAALGVDLPAKEETRRDDDTEQRVRTGNTGLSVWTDCVRQIVSVLRREFGLEGLRHTGYVRASVRRGESQLVRAGITTPGGQTSSKGWWMCSAAGETQSPLSFWCYASPVLMVCLNCLHTKLFRLISWKPIHLEETIWKNVYLFFKPLRPQFLGKKWQEV